MKQALIVIAGLMLAASALRGAQHSVESVEQVATYKGPGTTDGAAVIGSATGSERLYLAYMYVGHTVELVSVDPLTGKWQAFENPAKSEYGAIEVVGPDGNIYLGTRPHAHIFRLNPRTGEYKDLGQPAPGEAYIWQLTFASDGKLYGCTYPSSKLVRYDPVSGKLEDLGRMDPKEQYGYTIAASDDGFVYEGIGTAQPHLVAYQIATGEHRDILPTSVGTDADNSRGYKNTAVKTKTAILHKGDDGKIYAEVGNRHFLVQDWTAKEIPEKEVRPVPEEVRLQDGRIVKVDGNELLIIGSAALSPWRNSWLDPISDVERVPYTYPGEEGDVMRLAAGPDGRIYGSSILPFHLFTVDPFTRALTDFGDLGGGEAYSLVPLDHKLYIAAYAGKDAMPLMAFDPAGKFAPGTVPGSNPLLITYDGANTGWRPEAMVVGPDKKFYIGSVAGYGEINGPMTIFDPRTNEVTRLSGVVPDESVITLAATANVVVGGTSIFGGGGSHPTQKEARLFLWDPQQNRKIYETAPVPGATAMTDFLALPDGKVMGIATRKSSEPGQPESESTLFVFDLHSRKVDYTVPFEFRNIITYTYNSVALGPDGKVWGLVGDGIFRFDPKTRQVELMSKTPAAVTAGFALLHGSIYYASGPTIYRYRIDGQPTLSSGGDNVRR